MQMIGKFINEWELKLCSPSGVPTLQRLSNFSILNPLSFNSSANSGLMLLPPRAPESKKALALLISFTALIALSFALFPF